MSEIDCSKMSLSYNSDIKPILELYCIDCHGSHKKKGGYNFTQISDLKRAAKSGNLLGSIKWKKGYPKMPRHDNQLDLNTINKIECWVNNGMKE
jgi:hypothetical protein